MSILTNIFNGSAALTKGLGSAASGAADAAGKLLSGAGSAVSDAYKDICPGTTFQLGNLRTDDGITPNGKFKVCQKKNLFGDNDPPFYVDAGGVKHTIEKKNYPNFKINDHNALKGAKNKRSGRKHKKATMERKNKKSSNSRKHKKATMERKNKKASKKRSMKHKSW
jgi:hypothetical protein